MIKFENWLKQAGSIFSAIILLAACSVDPDVSERSDTSSGTELSSQADLESETNSTDDEFGDSDDDDRPIKAQLDVLAWGEENYGAALIEPVPVFFGDVNDDGKDDLMAVIYTETGASGFSVYPTVFISEGEDFLPYQTLGPIDGVEPRNVDLHFGEVSLTTTVHAEGDPMCCPTEPKSWTLSLDFRDD